MRLTVVLPLLLPLSSPEVSHGLGTDFASGLEVFTGFGPGDMDEFEHRCDASLDLAGWSKRFGILYVLSIERTTELGSTCGV